jgi:VanZ family protein
LKKGVGHAAFAVVLVGAIAMIALSIGNMFGLGMSLPVRSPLPDFYGHAVTALVLGLVAFVSSKNAGETVWGIVLIVIGYVGGGLGGLLVLVRVLGILSRYVP